MGVRESIVGHSLPVKLGTYPASNSQGLTTAKPTASNGEVSRVATIKPAAWAVSAADGYIAATAHAAGLMVATRDTSPFEAAGLAVINPWLFDAG